MFCIVFLSVLFLVRCGPKTLVYARKNMLPERFIKFIKNILFVKKIVVDQKIKVQGTLISEIYETFIWELCCLHCTLNFVLVLWRQQIKSRRYENHLFQRKQEHGG